MSQIKKPKKPKCTFDYVRHITTQSRDMIRCNTCFDVNFMEVRPFSRNVRSVGPWKFTMNYRWFTVSPIANRVLTTPHSHMEYILWMPNLTYVPLWWLSTVGNNLVPLLLTRIDFNPKMDKSSHFSSVSWNYLSMPKLQPPLKFGTG